ncbi:CHAP domain-containing protein [Azospirillum sp. sgz302134]
MAAFLALSPFAIAPAAAEDCVRTVRAISDFTLQGDAWKWWDRAVGQYERDKRPAAGSVLVFKRSGRLNRGHVSLVSHVIDRRTIEVDHSWLDGRGLRRNMRVVDVSRNNDWSAVRVWHEPSDQLGLRVYTTYGFILPEGEHANGRMMDANDSGIDTGFTVTPHGRGAVKPAPGPALGKARLMEASLKGRAVAMPGRKPQILNASLTPAPAKSSVGAADETVVAVLPRRKPAVPASVKTEVASVDGLLAPMPGRKPGSSAVAELSAE